MNDVKIENYDHIISYFKKERGVLSLVTISGLLYNIGMVAGPWFEGQLVQCLNDIIKGDKAFLDMIFWAAFYMGTILFVQFMRYIKRFYVRRFGNNVNRSLKSILYANLINESKIKLEQENIGSLMTNAISDVDDCSEGMRKFTTEIFDTGVVMIAYIVMLFSYDYRLAILSCIFPPFAYIIAEKLKVIVHKCTADYKESAGKLNSATLERISLETTYRIFGCESEQDKSYDVYLADYEQKTIKANIWSSAMQPIYQIIAMISVVFIIWFGGKNVLGIGWCTWNIAAFTTFLSCFMKLAVKSSKSAKLFNAVQKAQVCWKRIKPMMKYNENDTENKETNNCDNINKEIKKSTITEVDGEFIEKNTVQNQFIESYKKVECKKSEIESNYNYVSNKKNNEIESNYNYMGNKKNDEIESNYNYVGNKKSDEIESNYNYMSNKKNDEIELNYNYQKSKNLDVQGLSFSYPNGAELLHNISFTLEPGQILGVTGMVASGKSTFGKIFLCEYPYSGSVRWIGKELSNLQINRVVTYMGHQPELMSDTIEENICLGDDIDVWYYLKLVCMDKEVEAMSDGIRTQVGGRGISLSGGQQARIALARTLSHKRPIIILDDPFSAVDRKTELELYTNIREICRENIVILISHRLYLFPMLDKVLWLEKEQEKFSGLNKTESKTNTNKSLEALKKLGVADKTEQKSRIDRKLEVFSTNNKIPKDDDTLRVSIGTTHEELMSNNPEYKALYLAQLGEQEL